ncbi:hypothetical protein GIB67_006276 [Kingdonia uniflora]|uniref:UBX domain-containing protein n=1 Tax=Kingdonia uniflora TaxID=39325 RepID=A0A7J7P667_9MAGN|nr:hypothetical protein GIB67_006276 [Kingdonia uniflora]
MSAPSETEKQSLISSFVEIAVGQSDDTAKQFLKATDWKLEDAIQLFYVGNEGGGFASSSYPPAAADFPPLPDQKSGGEGENIVSENAGHADQIEEVQVRAPLPVKREALYDDAILYRAARMGVPLNEASSMVAFRNFEEEMKRPAVWDAEQSSASTTENARDNLASLYRPPFALMHRGPFDQAKTVASTQDKWLLVNLQSNKEFSSHMLNRDTWSNEAVAQLISNNFIFWQVYDDTTEGRKVCSYYHQDSIPVVLVIDPITGQKMRSWSGMIEPQRLLEDLMPYMDGGPQEHHVAFPHKRPRESLQTSVPKVQADEVTEEEDPEVLLAIAASMQKTKDHISTASVDVNESQVVGENKEICSINKPTYPPLSEEPKMDRSFLCRVGVRLPDGRRLQRNFLRTDPIQLLWSFCNSHLGEEETRLFRLTQAIPGASKFLDYDSSQTFGESGLANSMISVTWE